MIRIDNIHQAEIPQGLLKDPSAKDLQQFAKYILETNSTRIFPAKNGRVFTQQIPTGFFSFLAKFINYIERCIKEQTFPSEQEKLEEVLKRAKTALLSTVHNITNSPAQNLDDVRALINALDTLKNELTLNEQKAPGFKELIEQSSLELSAFLVKSNPIAGNALLRQNPQALGALLTESFLTTPPEEMRQSVQNTFAKVANLVDAREILQIITPAFEELPTKMKLIMTQEEEPSDALLEHAARHLCTFNQEIHAYNGPHRNAVINTLETFLAVSETWLTNTQRGKEFLGSIAEEMGVKTETYVPERLAAFAQPQPAEVEVVVVEEPAAPIQEESVAVLIEEVAAPAVEELPAAPVKPSGWKKVSGNQREQLVVKMFEELGQEQALSLLKKQAQKILNEAYVLVGKTGEKNEDYISRLVAIQGGLGAVLSAGPNLDVERYMTELSNELRKFAQL